jgi:hypothetical protein
LNLQQHRFEPQISYCIYFLQSLLFLLSRCGGFYIYRFLCDLFYDNVSNSDHIASIRE